MDSSDAKMDSSETNSATDIEKVQRNDAPLQEKQPDSGDTDSQVVDWDGPDDPNNPLNWRPWKRDFHVLLISVSCLFSNLASTMFAPGAAALAEEFDITGNVLPAFTVSIYNLGIALGPTVIAPLSEIYGRLPVIHTSQFMFLAFTLGCAFATNKSQFFAFRFLAGCAASTPIVLGGGVIADIEIPERRGRAMALWGVGPLLGPVIGPIIGGFVTQRVGWRWTFRLISIMSGLGLIAGLAFWRESNASVLLRRKAERLRRETGNPNLKARGDKGINAKETMLRALVRPIKLLLLSPIVLIPSLFAAVIFGMIYLVFTTFPAVFEMQYGFSTEISGLAYLGLGIGFFISLGLFGYSSDRVMTKLKGDGEATPEMRLPLMAWISPIVPIGFFWYGWSAQAHTHWIVPILGTMVIAIGALFVMMPTQLYLVDAFGPEAAASAIAANMILRTLLGAFLPLAGPPIYDALDFGWGNSVLGFICLAFVPVPIIFNRYGTRLRERYVIKL